MASLIGFEYPNYDSENAANDLYDRIKQIQDKLKTSPDSNHIVVIAMDGENCWENFAHDGEVFLNTLYSLIENDNSLEKNSPRKNIINVSSKAMNGIIINNIKEIK